MFRFFRKAGEQASKPSLEGIELYVKDIPGALNVVEKVPRVEWKEVRAAVKAYAEHPAIELLWTEMAAQWLGILRKHFGEDYKIYENTHLLMLSGQEAGAARRFLELGHHAYERLEVLLQRTPKERGHGKHAVIVFSTKEHYYDYISYFYAESDRVYGTSAGVHVKRGYRHTVINGAYRGSPLRTLVHELAHNMVAHRPLPLWVNEGLAQTMEDMVPGYRAPLISARQQRIYRRYWSWVGLKGFWEGSSFSRAGSQRPSYAVAEVLFRNLLNAPARRERLAEFLATADRKDAGAGACRACFGCSLGELVGEFLGEGEWEREEGDAAANAQG